jgi:hypothetical protein
MGFLANTLFFTFDVMNNFILGTIPSEIANWHHLRTLKLDGTWIRGTIPDLATDRVDPF